MIDIKLLDNIWGGHIPQDTNNISYCCPKHNDTKYHLSVNIHNGMFQCWTCTYKGNIKSLANYDVPLQENFYAQICDILNDKISTKSEPLEVPMILSDIVPGDEHYEYLRYRFPHANVDLVIKTYRIQACFIKIKGLIRSCIYMPIHNSSYELIGWQARCIHEKLYKSSRGFIKRLAIYHKSSIVDALGICEGIISMISADLLNIPSTCTFGKDVSDNQFYQILDLKPKSLYLMIDNDFFHKNIILADRYHNLGITCYIPILPSGMDLNDIYKFAPNIPLEFIHYDGTISCITNLLQYVNKNKIYLLNEYFKYKTKTDRKY